MKDDPRLAVLGKFTPDGQLMPGYGDHYIFLVGRDDCHAIMHYLLTHETLEHDFNAYGYDDPELNADVMAQIHDPNMIVQGTLDRTQASGVHEKQLLDADRALDPVGFSNSVAIGQSATHQISHTKGGVLVGLGIAYEGSMNWSASGEGTGISLKPGINSVKGWKAQNNTLTVSCNPTYVGRLRTQLGMEHRIALAQMAKRQEASYE